MGSLRRAVALVTLLALVPGARAAYPDDGGANLAEEIAKAMPEAQDATHHYLQFGLEVFDAVHVGILIGLEVAAETAGTTTATVAGLGVAMEVLGPVAAEAGVLLALSNAHAEAINSILEDQIRSGFSRGVVLGADDRPGSYVKENFVKFSPVSNAVYPEYGKKFQNAYNRALVAGYLQGRKLLEHKAHRSAFFEDLYVRMSVHPSVTYGEDQDNWSDRSWVDYYVECAAVFRATHLK
jgi:hypothetical protein